jgi:magnesium chelatase subunit D
MSESLFPFSAVHGSDQMRLALVLNAVSPAIGGVLVRGEKGTAKSTAVRALAALLPPVAVVAGCRFSCDPAAPEGSCPDGPHDEPAATSRPARLVELPVGASEDRVAGSLDLQRALSDGVRAFEPGLLAAAHRGILYVDEVNLLADHLVDVLLDASAMGRNHVERDAVSVSHPARFVLIGSMNPEEGELRPQLLDRFGLTVEVAASRDPAVRVEVIRRRLAADADPVAFAQRWSEAESALQSSIVAAQQALPNVELSDTALRQIAEVCAAFDVDGMRADIVTARTAMAHAAWQGRLSVTAEDVRVAATLALPHRRRRNPFDEPGLDPEALDEALERAEANSKDEGPEDGPDHEGPEGGGPETDGPDGGSAEQSSDAGGQAPQNGSAPISAAGKAKLIRGSSGQRAVAGRRAAARTGRGATTGASKAGHGSIHLVATITAAASRARSDTPLIVAHEDLRRAQRHGKQGNLVLFVVDASGSMAARSRMAQVKGSILALLTDAYQRRDKVGLITFRDKGSELILPPTTSVSNAARRLESLSTGGRTPLAAGLQRACQVVRSELTRDPLRRPLVLLITDGRADNAAAAQAGLALREHDLVVIDCESGPVRLGLARRLADLLHAEYLLLSDVTGALVGVVEQRRTA